MATDPAAMKLSSLKSYQKTLRAVIKAALDYFDVYGCVSSEHIQQMREANDKIQELIGVK